MPAEAFFKAIVYLLRSESVDESVNSLNFTVGSVSLLTDKEIQEVSLKVT